jgi:hypothetical protein
MRTYKTLNLKSRQKIADDICAIAQKYGGTCNVRADMASMSHTINIDFDEVSMMMDVHQSDFVMHWHNAKHNLSESVFGYNHNVNPHHHHKATTFAWSKAQLLERFEHYCKCVQDGSAFVK